jgi:hypothetical protein
MIFEGLRADVLVMKTLSTTPRPLYHLKAEDLSFLNRSLHVGWRNTREDTMYYVQFVL